MRTLWEYMPTGKPDRMGNESLLLDAPHQMLELLAHPVTYVDIMLGHPAL